MNNNRNFIGYGKQGKKINWPNNAKLAVQFVLNYKKVVKIVFLMEINTQKVFFQKLLAPNLLAVEI